jgi:hypothetical protein
VSYKLQGALAWRPTVTAAEAPEEEDSELIVARIVAAIFARAVAAEDGEYCFLLFTCLRPVDHMPAVDLICFFTRSAHLRACLSPWGHLLLLCDQ